VYGSASAAYSEANSYTNGVVDALTSDDIEEGSFSLYFTDQRALDATALTYDLVGSAASAEFNAVGQAQEYTDGRFTALTTLYVPEEENLYFTPQRAIDAASATYDAIGTASTAYTNAVAYADGLTTTDIAEGTSLYFTDERAQDAVGNAVGTGLTYTDGTGTIAVNTSVIQQRVANVTDTEIGYLDGVTSAIQTQIDTKAPIASPTFTGTVTIPTGASITAPTGLVKGDVGLGNVDNTSDANKPVSTATQTALDLKAPLASPTFTGTVVLPSTVNGPGASTSVNLLFGTGAGHITLGGGQTSGNLTLGGAAGRTTGVIGIGTGVTTTGTKTINIGTGSTGGTTAITVGSSSGATSNITLNGTVTLTADPSSALQAATKQYVDNVTAGINFHEAVHAASVSNLSTIYNNGTSGVGATLTADTNRAFSTLDGESVTVGQRVLIKNQTDAKQNGIYTLTTVGSGSAPWVITRATDADNNPTGELKTGDFCFVMAGTTNAGYGYVNNSTANPIVIGTDNITYTPFNAAQTITAGTGLDLTFNVMSLDATLDNLSNVIASSPSDGNFLKYVSASSAWIPAAIPTINALDDIGNVSASAPSNGEVLQWNGTAWVPSLVVGPNGLGYKVSGTVDTPIGQEAYGTVKFYADTTLYAYQVGDFVKGSLVYDLGGETISATGTSDSVIDADTFGFGYITFTTSPDDLTVYVGQYITASTPDDPYWVLRGQVSSIGSGTITAGMGVQVSPSTTGVTSEDWTVQRDIYTNPLPVDGINSNIYFKGLITEIVSGNYYSIYSSNYLNAFEGQDAILALAGADGAAGSTGAAGAAGADGADGSDGADGNDGNDGLGYPALQTPATQYYDTDTTFGSTGFTIDITGTAYIVGNRVRLVWNTSPDTYYEGKITAFDLISTTLTVDVDLAVGATGAKDVFNLALTGEPGPLETVGFSFSSDTANSASVAVTSVTVDPYGRVTAVSAGNYQFADSSNAGVVRIDGNDFLMDAGTLSIKTGAIYDGNVNASAGIALSKLASGTSGQVIVANSGGVPTYVTPSGDVTWTNAGVTSIKSNVALSGAPTAATATVGTNTTQIATTAFTTTAVRDSLVRLYMEVM
jgi:hypothetical protein